MNMSFKPSVIALLCGVGAVAVAGTVLVKNGYISWQQPQAAQTQSEASTSAAVTKSFTQPQLDQLVAPIALYPDPVLAQILMASTYPSNVVQAVQWSRDNPKAQGDSAVKRVANQPWDPSVKSLVALPQLLALMGENPEWVQNLGDAFLAQPDDVMNSVQKLRQTAQKNGSLTSNAQQKVIIQPANTTRVPGKSTTVVTSQPQTIIIEPTNPQVVYVPSYNPNVVYGTWATPAYPPVYLPPPPGEQFTNGLVSGIGFGIGVATTYALFSSLDWHDDDHHHHDDDHHHDDGYHDDGHGGNYHQGNNYVNNSHVNINVNNYNHITGGNIGGATQWQHNPAYRASVPYHDPATSQHFISGTTQASVGGNSANKIDLSSLHQPVGNQPVLSGQTHLSANPNLTSSDPRANVRGLDNGVAHMNSAGLQRQNAAAVFNRQTNGVSLSHAAANQPELRRQNAESVLHNRTESSMPVRAPINQHIAVTRNSVEQRVERVSQPNTQHVNASPNNALQNAFQQQVRQQQVRQQQVRQQQGQQPIVPRFNQQHENLFNGNASGVSNWHPQQERGNQGHSMMRSLPEHSVPAHPVILEHNHLQLHQR
ncbi:MAG: DUF3300 domain-containing protein [Hafnia alvei]|uniref:Protein of uncharacterized function (DUF3300) n=2 Tax=Hafnia alvei TaxID=569 RepID=A0A377PN48_HAFAL|nr:DUF3300 domain-containing protein [Hafnia alvei]KFC90493.1 putative exported protein [Hafnia alvei ATCC 13337]MCV9379030.1 DUF3300 domain-containing protein [Hafnia alvei]MDX6846231.1 DUF3300 domain-containing protein [Hafnia alvei]RLR06900.1 DUF3300 domain-containing protein [Hafnia alvei ATCC 13337]TBM33685.1 DUF3300 domain-containing protein [Hafnia alvei]